ncbi:Fe-S protein assembly co-chaperone HscB [Candida albicans P57072]|uniref:Fe-S protein assembly co-chaperone HscB n=1 Tax=Candida albicans P78048 TaxID=1094989 RepID=A0AB34PW31_CANAX|nr:Fe-S protein assembly co-chaperone HscB [Candida albicans P94015]KGR01266.1 Fe-S protein assembly co-chaperone HscB [Candida albicans GC75]KGR13112.1 Fe-S protein assembly co-chaperone HscB [Candida albicans P57072]KGR15898.1 Fe-S protein assembly co-chaperone HscB [Candida albicans P78048]KGU12185.1 Fe-S protein assembly co-chaperone HscB [Candida albicans P87]KGU33304.1 Fe-S protein assembly co-chaperone HscB [Candida albicans P75063]KHC37669.1 Fe-S protein assembly co-chaperone HscB [Ca
MITRLIGIAKSGIYRTYSTASFYELFPKNFPHGGPPQDSFIVNDKSLRREYRSLQSESHPDISSDTIKSSNINRAYTTLKNPYTRIAHFIHLKSPNHVNITDDAVAKKLIKNYQQKSMEASMNYKEMLMQVMEAHEQLELAESENELETLEAENNERIKTTEERINQSLKNTPIDWEELMMDAIRLKYWVNIQNGIKDWEPGKPVHLTH